VKRAGSTARRLGAASFVSLAVWILPFVCAASSLPRVRAIPDRHPSDRVLCLYDSTEGATENRNPLSSVLAPAMKRLGFEVAWWDVGARGLPAPRDLAGLRAVVTGFLDGAMRGAAKYPAFVKAAVSTGVRLVIIGNYGAWQESSARPEDAPYLPPDLVNESFEALGVRYRADWTSDPTRFSLELAAPALGPARDLTPEAVRHFYQFDPIRPDVRVLVSARRTDRPETAASAPVFTSATGAMALQRHLSASDLLEDPAGFHLDPEAFLQAALALTPPDPGTLIALYDPGSSESRDAMESLRAVSAYTGIPMVSVPLKEAGRLRPMDLRTHAGVLLAFRTVHPPLDQFLADLLDTYIRAGGRVASLVPVANPPISRALGNHTRSLDAVSATGLFVADGAFPGAAGLSTDAATVGWTALRATPEPDCRVLVRAHAVPAGPDVPLWWRCGRGTGEVSVLNASEFSDRAFLGFMVQAALDAAGAWAMPVLAAAVEFVDDCPLPMAGRILGEVGIEDTRFYADEFYGMLLEARKTLSIRPTFLAVFSYDDRVEPPFARAFEGTTAAQAIAFARRIVADDFPVGLHGANHMSPARSGGVSRAFPDDAAIAEWFAAARNAFAEVFGPANVPVVFVPPNNYMDLAAKRAIASVLPSVRILASVFSGSEAELVQDFDRDPDLPGVLDFPRTWAGHLLADEPLVQALNGILAYSVSSHFVHPDDILDPERSRGRAWSDLRRGFLEGASEIRRRFRFLRDRTVLEAARDLQTLLSLAVVARASEDRHSLLVERTSGIGEPVVLLVRFPPGCVPQVRRGGGLLVSDPESGRHYLRMDARELALECPEPDSGALRPSGRKS